MDSAVLRLEVHPIFMQEPVMSTHSAPRSIDHLVLPVKEVDDARARYGSLGFTVAPTGQHPFGTENCCIFLADETFLEPLAIAHRETCEEAAIKGNTFVRNDQTYRFRVGDEGFSHLVLKSQNADVDHRLYRQHGMSGGKKVLFARKFKTPDGESGKVSFKLAFAAEQRSPDSGFFACEVVSPVVADRSALQKHENGAVRLKEVIATEVNPTDFQYFLQVFLNQRHMDADSFGISFETQNTKISVLSPDGAQAFYGIEAERLERGMRFEGFVLAVKDMAALKTHLETNNIAFQIRGASLIVPPARGQGATIVFEAET